MATLTYPGEWRRWAPTPAEVLRHLKAFAERFKRATGRPLRCVWVREFQARGAPHFHLLVLWPETIRGERSMHWLSRTWFEVVGSDDERHLRAGTRIDYDDSLPAAIDPKRAAAYFAGYCQKNKQAQHQPPEGWANGNGSVGRYWGQRGLETATAQVPITRQDDIELRRIMRKLIRSQKRTMQRRVGRNYKIVHTLDGEVVHTDGSIGDGSRCLTTYGRTRVITSKVATKTRRVNRRWKLRSLSPAGPAADGERGFLVFCNDAPLMATQLSLAIVQRGSDCEPTLFSQAGT